MVFISPNSSRRSFHCCNVAATSTVYQTPAAVDKIDILRTKQSSWHLQNNNNHHIIALDINSFHKDTETFYNYGESVAQSKSTRSRKPKLSTIERGHQMDGWKLRAWSRNGWVKVTSVVTKWMGDRKVILLGLAPALKFSPESNSMSEFGGLWKQQNNQTCPKSVKSL